MKRASLAIFIALFMLVGSCLGENSKQLVTLDFVDASLSDVARSLSLAYGTSILVDEGAEKNVTFHLDNVGLLEGISALCSTHGLEVFEDGGVLHVRSVKSHGISHIEASGSLVTLLVEDKDVREFLEEYAANTGLNILASPDVQGRISGSLRNMPPERALSALLENYGFCLRRENGCLHVERKNATSDASNKKVLEIFRRDSLYSVNLKNVPLADVLHSLSEASSLNLALYGDFQTLVSQKFENVSLKTLVSALLKGERYVFKLDSVDLYVAENGAGKSLMKMELYLLKYVNSEKALSYLQKFSPGSNFTASEVKEQNALLLGGSIGEIEIAKSLLSQVDVPSLQVTLSCVIVEFKRGKNFEIGLRSGNTRKTAAGDIGVRGFFDFLESDISKTGAFGKIGILPDRFELELASLEENNAAEVLARPKLTTLNGSKAELNVTNTVYYLVSQVSSDGYPITDYRSFNDGISLELTPIVSREGSVMLEVSPEIKTAGRSSGDGPRDISTRNLKTTVVLKNGETLCLGGLVRKSTSDVRTSIPFLGSIPLLGYLFSYLSKEEDNSELAIFITPEINGEPRAR